jgi:PGF-pre-PGF domain-containing protein
MKRPIAFLLLIIAIAWLLKAEQLSISGATSAETGTICGNTLCEVGENNNNCPDDCPDAVCGNNAIEKDEECDGIDDSLCPELCQKDCTCPPANYRNIAILPYRYTFSYDKVNQNEVQTLNLGRPKVAFQGASLVFDQSFASVRVIVDSNITAPPITPLNLTYAYFRVFLENSSQEQSLSYIELFFRVPTSWTIEHNVKEIQLQHAGSDWESVKTEKLSEDLQYTYFVARPLTLGVYAIVGNPPPTIAPVCGNGKVENGETAETCCADAGCPQGQSCISNKCKYVTVCGNNLCDLTENATSCPADCAAVQFKGSAATTLVILLAIFAAVMLFLYRKLPELFPKKPVARVHATPERWF